jgi:hypothetical protein
MSSWPAYSIALVLPWLNPLTWGPTQTVAQGLLTWLCGALFFITWHTSQGRDKAPVPTIVLAWVGAASTSAVMALLQYLGLAAHFSPWVNFVEAGQAYANLRQRNQLATLLAIGLSALLCLQARPASGQDTQVQWNTWARRAVHTGAVLVLVAADAASGSRTGLLQLLLLLALGFVWKRGQTTLLVALLGYLLAAVLLPQLAGLDPLHSGILGRMEEAPSACSSRLTLWSNVLHLIAQKPWLGWGWGELGYAHFVTLYQGPRFCEILGNAHNLPLHLAVELGLPFAVLCCGLMVWLVLRARPWCERDATRQLAWSVLAVIGLHSLLEYPLWYGPFQLATVLSLWLLWPRAELPVPVSRLESSPRWTVQATLTQTAAGLLLLVCAYAGWDYWRISQIYLAAPERAQAYRENTLEKIRGSWLFAKQVKFAELGITPLTQANAPQINTLAKDMLHFSPEARVAEKLIDSAVLLGDEAQATYYVPRYQAAFPQDYAAWKARNAKLVALAASHKAP